MKIPQTIDDLFRSHVVISWHAGVRLVERAGLELRGNMDAVALAMLRRGVIVGGQLGEQLLVKVTEHNARTELAFVLQRHADIWVVRTVLTWEQAVANQQAAVRY